jgi:hypothetical protein
LAFLGLVLCGCTGCFGDKNRVFGDKYRFFEAVWRQFGDKIGDN